MHLSHQHPKDVSSSCICLIKPILKTRIYSENHKRWTFAQPALVTLAIFAISIEAQLTTCNEPIRSLMLCIPAVRLPTPTPPAAECCEASSIAFAGIRTTN
ncbi:hypothetical protein MLD38_034610 [Melastoma candidum]|uniref:Uncharacterized protein n=1 Tax=Melastoma candidum TaxID=119954 RepID=A0ACB9MB36_9MYRT|nr:hypothetical protein MLD38_034610 [Melastoma candidum]